VKLRFASTLVQSWRSNVLTASSVPLLLLAACLCTAAVLAGNGVGNSGVRIASGNQSSSRNEPTNWAHVDLYLYDDVGGFGVASTAQSLPLTDGGCW
jgi:hypothetical protein